jgi:hypothetical protein
MSALEIAHNTHQEAMGMAESAFVAELRGNHATAREMYHRAFVLERAAAEALASDHDAEPTRSILYRSAATLGLRCGELRDAERLVAIALVGNPPEEVADELRQLFDEITFSRHLKAEGVTLGPNGFQMSLWGKAVSSGLVLGTEFMNRYRDTERLIYRTAERSLKQPFGDSLQQSYRRNLELFMSVPRAASFAVTVTIGIREQQILPGTEDLTPSVAVVDELLGCLRLFNEREDDKLRERIGDPAYYTNFIGLAKRIAPDGEKIRGIGFTAIRGGSETSVGLTRPRQDAPPIATEPIEEERTASEGRGIVEIRGQLNFADARSAHGRRRRRIILESDGREFHVIVPPGLMRDIVRPLWEQTVVVRGRRKGKSILLEDINSVDDNGE